MPVNAEKLRTECRYEAQAPLGAVLAEVAEIGRVEEKFAAVRRGRRWIGFGLLIAAALGIVLAIASDDMVGTGVLVFFGGLIAAIFVFVWAYRYGRNLKKYAWRYGLVGQIGAALAQDMDAAVPVSVAMGLKEQGKLLREEVWPARRIGKQRFTEDDWLTFQGKFLDGTEVWESVLELVRKRTYVNPRGKHKSKSRSWHFVTIRLACPKERYGDLQRIGEGLKKAIRLPATASVRGLKVGAKAIALKVRVDEVADLPRANVMAFLGLYRALNLARGLEGRRK